MDSRAADRQSLLIFLALMVYLAAVKVVLSLVSIQVIVEAQAGLFSWPMIVGLCLLG